MTKAKAKDLQYVTKAKAKDKANDLQYVIKDKDFVTKIMKDTLKDTKIKHLRSLQLMLI